MRFWNTGEFLAAKPQTAMEGQNWKAEKAPLQPGTGLTWKT